MSHGRRDYNHEEAGITMVGSALEKLSNWIKNVFVTADDTDVLILLIYFIQKKTPQETSTYTQRVLMARSSMWRHLPPCLVPNVPSFLDCIVYQAVIQIIISLAKVN